MTAQRCSSPISRTARRSCRISLPRTTRTSPRSSRKSSKRPRPATDGLHFESAKKRGFGPAFLLGTDPAARSWRSSDCMPHQHRPIVMNEIYRPATNQMAQPKTGGGASAGWPVAGMIAVTFMGSTLVTPLYVLYRQAFGFSAITLTLVYAAYVVGNLGGLLFLGR